MRFFSPSSKLQTRTGATRTATTIHAMRKRVMNALCETLKMKMLESREIDRFGPWSPPPPPFSTSCEKITQKSMWHQKQLTSDAIGDLTFFKKKHSTTDIMQFFFNPAFQCLHARLLSLAQASSNHGLGIDTSRSLRPRHAVLLRKFLRL